jgi:hypothetical protein
MRDQEVEKNERICSVKAHSGTVGLNAEHGSADLQYNDKSNDKSDKEKTKATRETLSCCFVEQTKRKATKDLPTVSTNPPVS